MTLRIAGKSLFRIAYWSFFPFHICFKFILKFREPGAGHTLDHFKETGQYESMKTVMLGDRIYDRAEEKEMIILGGTTKFNQELRMINWEKHLKTAYDLGRCL